MLIASVLVGAFVLAGARPVDAQIERRPMPILPDDTLYAKEGDAFLKIGHSAIAKGVARTADIIVEYRGFSPAARQAFQHAVEVWETHITSDVPIYVVAYWDELGERTLGAAGPTFVYASSPDDPSSQHLPEHFTWYPSGLAQAIMGIRANNAGNQGCSGLPVIDGQCPDIQATFNSNLDLDGDGDSDWSFAGFDIEPGQIQGQYHLATVVLHELGHGLGFIDSFDYDDGTENDECPEGPTGSGCWGFGTGSVLPYAFDRFIVDAQDVPLINESVYPNPSIMLGDALQSDAVFFDGDAVRRVNQDVPADLYAPTSFEPGSSIAHLDEAFFNRTDNALMTPQLQASEIIATPGPITCALFLEIGWPLGQNCQVFINPELLAFDAAAQGGGATIEWTVAGDASVEHFVVERSAPVDCSYVGCADDEDANFVAVDTVAIHEGADTTYTYQLNPDDLPLPGRYLVRLRVVREVGTSFSSDAEEVALAVPESVVLAGVYPNPFDDQTVLNLVVRETQQIQVRVYNTLGRLITMMFDGGIRGGQRVRLDLDADGLAAGVYFIRIDGETFTETRQAVKL